MDMFGATKKKIYAFVGIFIVLLSSIVNVFVSSDIVSASTASYEQTYVSIKDIYREDNDLHVILKDELLVKDMTYEYTHYVDEVFESDLVVVAPKQLSTYEYLIELPEDTVGVKVWKVKYQVENDYFKNKYTVGPNSIGDIGTTQKKNYITVTADKLVTYEYSTQNLSLPWYTWNPTLMPIVLGDYLFREETSASYTWYFNIDKEIDRIIDVNITYATFEYSEILWGAIESKHDYQTHGPMKITAEQQVFDYAKFIDYAEDKCGFDFAGGTCNNMLKAEGEEYFKHSAIGSSSYIDNEGVSYDWYVQVTLDDLLKENNVLWGAYENKEYLQEVTLLNISYYFEGEEYFDVNVLDEDTGEADIIPDPSPIDRLVSFIDELSEWFSENWKVILIVLAVAIILIILVIKLGFKMLGKIIEGLCIGIWYVLKWTIFLPFTLPYVIIKNRKEEKKKQEDFAKLMENYNRSKKAYSDNYYSGYDSGKYESKRFNEKNNSKYKH